MTQIAYCRTALMALACVLGPVLLCAQEYEQVNTTSPQTLEHKTLTTPSILSPYIGGTVTGTPTILGASLPDPTITGTVGGGATYIGPAITSPSVSGTVSGGATYAAPTLTNPTISGTVAGGAAYTAPTLHDATLVNPKQFGTTIKTIEGSADVATAAANCINATLVVTTPSTVVSSNVTFGDTCLLWFMGGSFSINANISATISHVMASPYYPIFTGAGCTTTTTCVNFTRGRTVYPEWWGAYAGASASANQTAGILAINSLPAGAQGGGIVLWSVGTYDHNGTFYSNSRYVTFRGMGMYSTKLRQTTTANLRHGLSCSGSTGYLGVEDMEISPSAAVTSDLGMKAVNFNSDEGASGGASCTPASASILHVERFKSTGYNFGVYGDGGDSILIQRAECINCTIKVHGAGGASISESVVFQRTEWGITDKSDLSCDSNTCDHAIYAIHVQHIRTTNSKLTGFNNEAVKYITNNTGGKPDPGDWMTQGNEFRGNGADAVYTVDGGYTLEQAVYRHNRHFSTGLDSLTSVYIQAINAGNIRSCACDSNYWEGVQAQTMKLEASAGSTFDFADATKQTVKTFGSSATNTYVAINYGGAGTMRYALVGGFFDGGTYGKRAHALMQGGTGFVRVDAIGLYEINMAGGATPPSPNVMQQEMGGSASFAPSLQRAYCTTTATGTDANTTEKDLATFDLPANLLFTNNAGVWLEAWGTTAANGNTKTIKVYAAGTALVQNSVNTTPNNLGWMARASIHRRGSGSQTSWATMVMSTAVQGTAVSTLSANDTAAITVKVTGQNGTGNANEITLQGFCVYFVPPYPIW